MGYRTRFKLQALDPTTLQPANVGTWPMSYLRSVGSEVGRYTETEWNPATGDLFYGEPCTWYSYAADFTKFSGKQPQFIWVLRGDGEEAEDAWILYAYRGTSYRVAQEPWVPPPPDMRKLPPVVRVPIPTALPDFLARLSHVYDCAFWNHPLGGDEGQCDCPIATIREALVDLEGKMAEK